MEEADKIDWLVYWCATSLLEWRCAGGPVCSSSGKPHIILKGRDSRAGQARTKIAEQYPTKFANAIAEWLLRAARARGFRRVCRASG